MKVSRLLFLCLLSMNALARGATMDAVACAVAGNVESAGPGSMIFHPLRNGEAVSVGSTVRTGDDGSVVLTATPGSAVKVGPDSVLKINELAFARTGLDVTERKARLELTSGVVSALIDPSTPKITDFQIQTPQGVAAARGTYYAVTVRDGKTYVKVRKGLVASSQRPESHAAF